LAGAKIRQGIFPPGDFAGSGKGPAPVWGMRGKLIVAISPLLAVCEKTASLINPLT